MHSDKVDYKENIYKPLLKLGLMNDYYLILPLSEKYKADYIKELISDSDVVICDLTKFNILSNFELNMAKKLSKPIYYFINSSDKKINKYKDIEIVKYQTSEEFSLLVKRLLDSLNKKELILKRENIYCLGNLEK